MVEFIFFLTYNDVTIYNALDVFEMIRDTGIKYIGFKDVGLSKDKLMDLNEMIKRENMTSVMEVVSYSEQANIRSVKMAVELGVDYVIGGTYLEQMLPLIENTKIKYFPYVGKIEFTPTGCLLRGSIEEIVNDAKKVEAADADGIDLLAYRYDGDIEELVRSVVKTVKIPVIAAGSIDSLEKICKMAELGVWGFTIGTAILDRKIVPGRSTKYQIITVIKEIEKT